MVVDTVGRWSTLRDSFSLVSINSVPFQDLGQELERRDWKAARACKQRAAQRGTRVFTKAIWQSQAKAGEARVVAGACNGSNDSATLAAACARSVARRAA